MPYTASKGAVKMLTKRMAVDPGPRASRQRHRPSYFKTELNRKLIDDAALQRLAGRPHAAAALGRGGGAAGAAVFLASDDTARFVNGHILTSTAA